MTAFRGVVFIILRLLYPRVHTGRSLGLLIALMMEAASTSEASVTSTTLHDATTQKTAIFMRFTWSLYFSIFTSFPHNFESERNKLYGAGSVLKI
jgi:hypothetical protein